MHLAEPPQQTGAIDHCMHDYFAVWQSHVCVHACGTVVACMPIWDVFEHH